MLRRQFPCWLSIALVTLARAAEGAGSLRGKLTPGAKPTLAGDRGPIALEGDAGTMLVLGDRRLGGLDFEVVGELAAVVPGPFRVGPLHKRSMFVHKGGKRLIITYWCEVCSIRTFTPGGVHVLPGRNGRGFEREIGVGRPEHQVAGAPRSI